MNILYCYNEKTGGQDILWGFIEEGHSIHEYEQEITPAEHGEKEQQTKNRLINYLKEKLYDGVVSWNFFPSVSDACEQVGIPYMSWIYDSPLLHVFSNTIFNSCNYIFVFDKKFATRLKQMGANSYYMPLAVNTTRLGALQISDEDIGKYTRDIAFVGSLYQDNLLSRTNISLPMELSDKIQTTFGKQLGDWTHQYLYSDFSEEEVTLFNTIMQVDSAEFYPHILPKEIGVGLILDRKFAEIERTFVLNQLGENFQVTLYNSQDKKDELYNVECRPGVPYETEAPKVFFSSKINLNLTLRAIETGVSLRVFDVTGTGGFLLSNYQQELEELFVPDKEVVMFKSMEELMDKARYYLKHQDKRQEISMNGYIRSKTEHAMKHRVHQIMEITYGRK